MGTRDPRIDEYIDRSAEFARPILKHLRATVHAACPDVQEDIKWGMPHFLHNGMFGCMAAFKHHCAFALRGGLHVFGPERRSTAIRDLRRITSFDELPSKAVLIAYVKKAVAYNDARAAAPRKPKRARPALRTPADLAAALARNSKARGTFDSFSPSHRREYIEWITDAKREETRKRRVETAIAWMAEGKSQNWRYERPRPRS